MMILLRHDDSAQVIVHTANMIPQDWANMTQAVWRSPLLPLVSSDVSKSNKDNENKNKTDGICLPIGSGSRFKHDLLRYLQVYGSRTASIVSELRRYDFGAVRAAFVASVPGRMASIFKPNTTIINGNEGRTGDISFQSTAWGWQGLQQVLESIECEDKDDDYSHNEANSESDDDEENARNESKDSSYSKVGTRPQINIQMSSIASLGQKDTWLRAFIDVLSTSVSSSTSRPSLPSQKSKTYLEATTEKSSKAKLRSKKPPTQAESNSNPSSALKPIIHIIWPTVADVRNSLNGYASGGSIHMRLKSATATKQMEYLRPYLCRWSTAKKPTLAILREKYEKGVSSSSSASGSIGASSDGGPLIRNIDPSAMLEHDNIDAKCKGSNDTCNFEQAQLPVQGRAYRNLAAPHIKTYIRFSRRGNLDWALVTSANLSTQAWGVGRNKTDGSVRVCSWEAGILVWPGLWEDEDGNGNRIDKESQEEAGNGRVMDENRKTKRRKRKAKMVPVFGRDTPTVPHLPPSVPSAAKNITRPVTVAFRMPYDMPLIPYNVYSNKPRDAIDVDEPWSADQLHAQPDWRGIVWNPSLLGL